MTLLDADVLRRMAQEHLQAHQRGELSADELRGYVTALFHAGVLSADEVREFLAKTPTTFSLTPPPADTAP